MDYTIDRVSLFALIFSIGILVDDATVVIENIFRHWLEKGKTSVAIAVDAVREVGNPTIIATLTIISALLPMGWVSGLMGPYMRPIPVLGSSAMFFSLVAAFIFTPWFAVKVAPRMAALENRITSYNVCYTKLLRQHPRRILFAEGESSRVLQALQVIVEEDLCRPVLVSYNFV